MRLLTMSTVAVLAVALSSGCGGTEQDYQDWLANQHEISTTLRLDTDQALQISPTREQLQTLQPLGPPDPGDASSKLYPDHYTLSDDQFCGHTGCPADDTKTCKPHGTGLEDTLCACRVRGMIFLCH